MSTKIMSIGQISILIAVIGGLLTIFGFAISKAVKVGEMRVRVKQLEDKVALDVEDFSLTVLINHVDSDIFNELKNYVYNAPCPLDLENKETGEKTQLKSPLTLEVVLKVMSIYLRDKYFEVHPEVGNAQ